MRSLGEQFIATGTWNGCRRPAYALLFCLFAQTHSSPVGAAIIYFSNWKREPVLLAIGMGIIAYAARGLVHIAVNLAAARASKERERAFCAKAANEISGRASGTVFDVSIWPRGTRSGTQRIAPLGERICIHLI